jgi:hypothetical protein
MQFGEFGHKDYYFLTFLSEIFEPVCEIIKYFLRWYTMIKSDRQVLIPQIIK